MSYRLVLFDIDGTLVRVDRDISQRVIVSAMQETIGVDGSYRLPESYRFHGRTDRSIFIDLCEMVGIEREESMTMISHFEGRLMAGWEEWLREESVVVLPGVMEILHRLQDDESVILGLLTGNIASGARAKLAPHNLNRFFEVGAFGSDAIERNDIPPFALERAKMLKRLNGTPLSYDQTVIIGDSNRDIACAKRWGIRSIAVATGGLTTDELAHYEPDVLFHSLHDTDEVLKSIYS